MNLTPGADIERLRSELNQYAQDKQSKHFTKTPKASQLMEWEEAFVDDGTTITKVVRIGNKIKTVTYT